MRLPNGYGTVYKLSGNRRNPFVARKFTGYDLTDGKTVRKYATIGYYPDRAAALQAELDKSQAATVNAEKFMGIVRKHLAFEELTPTLLREMVEKIVVHECSYDENGTRRQDIEIYYSFVGKIDLPE